MTRLERYKNHLIPIDDVAYVEFLPKRGNYQAEFYYGTFVRVKTNDSGILNTIQISTKNVLDDFNKWLRSFDKSKTDDSFKCPLIGGLSPTPQPQYPEPIIVPVKEKPYDPYAPYCISYTTDKDVNQAKIIENEKT